MTMLDRMRRHKNWLKWSLAVVVLTFVLLYIPDFVSTNPSGTGAAPGETVADVGGHRLTAGDFQQRYISQVQAYRNQFGGGLNSALLRQLGIDQQILTQMIEEQVALIEADKHGIRVTDDELAQQIFAIPGLQENGQFIGEARYEQLLRSQNPPMTKGQFEQSLRRSLVLDKLRATLTDWMAVADSELEREYKQRNEKVKLQVVALTADRFRDKVTVTDADVASHFESHKAEYRIGEQRKIKYLLLDRDQARQKVVVPPTDIQQYYNDNIQQYQTPEQIRASHILLETTGKDEATVRKQAEAILQQVKSGADFAELAKKVSEDKGSKANGGDLDYFGRGRMVPEFEEAAFKLQPGQISDLVKSQFGFHIIKLVDKRPGSTRSLDEVRGTIQQQLAMQTADQLISDRARQLESRIDDPGDLDAVAKELGVMVQESGVFQREDPVPGLGAAPQVASEAFRLNEGQVSKAIASARGPVFMATAEKKDPYVPKLDEVKDRVREDVIRTRATELSRQRASAIAAALKAAPNFTAAAKAQGFEAKDTELIARASALPDIGVSPEVDKVAFGLPSGGVSDPIQTSDGTVIVRVVERDEVTPDEFRQAKEAFRAELLNERRGRFFSAYMAKAKERMNIEINADVVRRVTATYQL
ncbi:MAG TPA: peptidyl-prolyl cis-trans isomerase [Vicinamibacterales bacterium]|nr:peptidyl-prolyl cis-trans isomerase [Vicinamibacterales bacterium]